jgi:prepilin-type N-terminal cleavage/methylation domain-containing protein
MSRQLSALSFQPVWHPPRRVNVGRGEPTLHGRHGGRPLQGFTLVEVLIVIVVISLLIAVIGLVGVKVVHHQKVALTEAIIRDVKMAIDRFAELDPLKNIYDRKGNVTFGPYPPYMLANNGALTVGGVLEPAGSLPQDYVLDNRFHRDLNNREGDVTQFSAVRSDANDDIRALYGYLRVYVADAMSQIPQNAIKRLPLNPSDPAGAPGLAEYVNPAGTGTNPPGDGAIDVLGLYDAWGVPLNYFLYVKLEWVSTLAFPNGQWQVTQRIPVLHSWGISAEEYQAELARTDALDPQLSIFSDPFPSPAAAGVDPVTGAINGAGAANAGWARALPAGDERIGYVP